MRSTKKLVRTDGTEQALPSKCEGIKVQVGDVLYFNTWGGGGWGDPLKRAPQLVLDDINRKLATVEGALDYGVVIRNGKVDPAATKKLRAEMEKARGGKPPVFNFGPPLEEIRKRCKQETGLDAPVAPVFR
jgi:N-methylhydantoinase B